MEAIGLFGFKKPILRFRLDNYFQSGVSFHEMLKPRWFSLKKSELGRGLPPKWFGYYIPYRDIDVTNNNLVIDTFTGNGLLLLVTLLQGSNISSMICPKCILRKN